MAKNKKVEPAVVIRNGEPAAVILEIDEYRELLERVEDAEDLAELEVLKKKALKFKKLEDALKDLDAGV